MYKDLDFGLLLLAEMIIQSRSRDDLEWRRESLRSSLKTRSRDRATRARKGLPQLESPEEFLAGQEAARQEIAQIQDELRRRAEIGE